MEDADHVVVGFEPDGSLVYVAGTDETAADGPKYVDGVKLAEYGVHNLTDRELGTLLSDPKCSTGDRRRLRAEQSLREEIALWARVIVHPSGLGLDFGGGLISVQRKEDGSFEVEWEIEDGAKIGCKAFVASDPEGAARFLAEKRRELDFGLDLEGPVED